MSKSSTAARRLPNREAALEALYSDISAKSMFPFWATSTDVAVGHFLPDPPGGCKTDRTCRAASNGARRQAKVRQSGEVDPGPPRNGEGGDFS